MLVSVTRSTATAAASVERECLRAAGLVVVGVGVVVVLLWAASFPGWPLAAGVIVSVLVLGGLIMIWRAEPAPAARWLRPAGLVAALVLAVGGAIVIEISDDIALQARFERSRKLPRPDGGRGRPISHDVADHWLPYPGDCPARIGSYGIAECHAFTGGFMYLQERGALGDDAGFAYAPDGLRPGVTDCRATASRPSTGPGTPGPATRHAVLDHVDRGRAAGSPSVERWPATARAPRRSGRTRPRSSPTPHGGPRPGRATPRRPPPPSDPPRGRAIRRGSPVVRTTISGPLAVREPQTLEISRTPAEPRMITCGAWPCTMEVWTAAIRPPRPNVADAHSSTPVSPTSPSAESRAGAVPGVTRPAQVARPTARDADSRRRREWRRRPGPGRTTARSGSTTHRRTQPRRGRGDR